MITFKHKGDFRKTDRFLRNALKASKLNGLEALAQKGVRALAKATPVESGKTAESWDYEIKRTHGAVYITWFNTNANNGVNIAVILQYGHGTGTGGYVAGRDYINPAIRPIFDEIADKAWKEVTKA